MRLCLAACASLLAGTLLSACNSASAPITAGLAPQVPVAPVAQGEIARGSVYLDRNGNLRRDPDEPGVPEVSVSNGLDVVRTAADGGYQIPLPEGSILFISKPPQYDIPVDESQLPRFFYRHYPEGSAAVAQWVYPVIEPTGPLPERIDFALIESDDAANPYFRALVFADPQAGTEDQEDMFREDIIAELIGNPYDARFGVTVGDVVNDNLNLYPRHKAIMASIGIPQWYLPGNHDLNFESPDDTHSLETYKRHFGPPDYSFTYGNVHFIALDNVDYDGSGYVGRLSERQLAWIENDLRHVPRSRLIVIATHIPLITEAGTGATINTVNFDQLVTLLQGFERVYGIAGHDTSNSWKVNVDHRHGFFGYSFVAHTLAEARGSGWNSGPRDERGVRAATMQDGNPNGYYVMTFDGDRVQPRFVPASGNPVQNMRFTLEPPLGDQSLLGSVADLIDQPLAINRGPDLPGRKLVVNVFDGGERDDVRLSLNGAPAEPLRKVLRTDPYMEQQFARYQNTLDQFPEPVVSSHIWEYDLPSPLPPGRYAVQVTSLDEFGQTLSAGFAFEITP
jgi:3',5'-cyclic AMP phosphodiesterase CpdA